MNSSLFPAIRLMAEAARAAVGTFLIACLCAACSSSSHSDAEKTLAIRLVPAYSDSVTDYALEQASTRLPMVVDLDVLGLRGRFASARVGSQGTAIRLDRIASDVSFPIVFADSSGRERTIQVRAMPSDFPTYTTAGASAITPGTIYTSVFTGFTPHDYSYHLILATDGSPSYFRRFDHPTFNFHKVTYADGTVRYAYLDSPLGFDLNKGAAEGDLVLIDETFQEVRRGRLAAFGKHGILPAENHDDIVFADDHWVLSAYDTRTVDLTAYGGKADSKVVASILQEVKAGVVVWEWDSTDYPELYAASTEGNDFTNAIRPLADYVHFNSMEYDPTDKGYILSFRNQDAIMKIIPSEQRAGSPIPLKWILGGRLDQFRLTAEQKFYHQHDARILSRQGSSLQLSLFNNNNNHYNEHPSSAMVLTIAEDVKGARVDDEYFDSMQSTSQGSVQVLGPRHYFIGWGSDNRITEVLAGTKLFTIDFNDAFLLYRARKGP